MNPRHWFLLKAFHSLPFLGYYLPVMRMMEQTARKWGTLVILSVCPVLDIVLSPWGTTVNYSHLIGGIEKLINLFKATQEVAESEFEPRRFSSTTCSNHHAIFSLFLGWIKCFCGPGLGFPHSVSVHPILVHFSKAVLLLFLHLQDMSLSTPSGSRLWFLFFIVGCL